MVARYARTPTPDTIAPGLSLSAHLRTQAPRGHSHSPIAQRSRPFGCSARYARTSPSVRHYLTWVPPRYPLYNTARVRQRCHSFRQGTSSRRYRSLPLALCRWSWQLATLLQRPPSQSLSSFHSRLQSHPGSTTAPPLAHRSEVAPSRAEGSLHSPIALMSPLIYAGSSSSPAMASSPNTTILS